MPRPAPRPAGALNTVACDDASFSADGARALVSGTPTGVFDVCAVVASLGRHVRGSQGERTAGPNTGACMDGLMMDFPLTLPALFRRTEQLFPGRLVASRRCDRVVEHATYGGTLARARGLALALRRLGVRPGDRVGTICWTNRRHLEAYFAVPWMGAVLHTVNPRLHPEEVGYVVDHAGDRVVLVDDVLLPLWRRAAPHAPRVEHVVVVHEAGPRDLGEPGLLDYETVVAAEDPVRFAEPALDERAAASMCYTSGTTGRPKGVVYSHRSTVLHALVGATDGTFAVRESDTVVPVVPMFHVNAWGLPYTCALVGAAQVLPGPHLDPASLLDLFERERVTFSAGVPTVWLAVLAALDADPARRERLVLRALGVGGSAPPEAMIRAFGERHRIPMIHGWGMTETSPVGSVAAVPPALADAPADARYAYVARQGRPLPFFEIRARGEDGALVPWDGAAAGELEVRGAWVASAYYEDGAASADRWTADGWFRTGDVVAIGADGTITITDRTKDLIKSGGEWISSVALENALMGHPAVAEAAVVAVPDPKWHERPLAVVVPRPGQAVTPEELRAHLAPGFARWWVPERFEFVDAIPRGATGKVLKRALREQYAAR
jgi:fatty-acyl-CoA synthase